MARIPILQSPTPQATGNATIKTPDLPAVTNAGLGKALSDVGQVASDIYEKSKRANDVTHLTNASLEMQKAQLDFATFQQSEPDESKWLPKWQDLQNDIKSRFDQKELTPDARVQLTDRFSNWATRGTIMVQANAFKQTGQRMDATVELAKRKAVESGDLSTFKRVQEDRRAAGFGMTETDALEYAQVEDAAKAKKIQSLRAQESEYMRRGNQGDSEAWIALKANYEQQKELGGLDEPNYKLAQQQANMGELQSLIQSRITGNDGLPVDLGRAKKLISESDLTPQMKAQLENDVSMARKRYANQDIISFTNRMANGEAIDGNDFSSQYMESAELMDTRSKINEAVVVTPEQEARFYLDTMAAIDDFNPDMAKEGNPSEVVKMAKAALGIRKSPPHLRNLLAQEMQLKMSGSEDKSIIADGEKTARDMLLQIVKSKEAEFFTGSGADKKLNPAKTSEWMKFQQRIFDRMGEVSRRIKDVKDTKNINQIVSDVLGEDYVKAKKSAYIPDNQSGFGPMARPNPNNPEMDMSLLPIHDYKSIKLGF